MLFNHMSTASIPFAILPDHTYLYSNALTEQHRELYHRKQLDLICPECGAALMIVLNNNQYYFKHFSHQSCILDSDKMQREYQDYLVTQSHESEKHKSLKNALIKKLLASDDPLIDKTSVCIEKFTDRRRADVYCERNGRKIALEIQISPLSLSIILARIDHYRKKNIHLFWIIECDDLIKKQYINDIKTYGSSEHLYELSLDEKLLKCHFQAPEIYYENGTLYVRRSFQEISINLSDLKLIDNQPTLLDYDKEENHLKILRTYIQEAAIKQDLDKLNTLYNDLYLLMDNKPFFSKNYALLKEYLDWLLSDPALVQNNALYATQTTDDFLWYIEGAHPKYVQKFYEKDDEDDEPNLLIYCLCPKCQAMDEEYTGRIIVKRNKGSCDYCDYKQIDLITYLADMLFKSDKLNAAKEICHNLTIPYKSGI